MHGIVDSLWLKREGAARGRLREAQEGDRGGDEVRHLVRGHLQVDRVPAIEGGRAMPGPQQVLRRVQGREAQGPRDRGEAPRHARLSSPGARWRSSSCSPRADTIEEARAMVDGCVGIFLRHARSLLGPPGPSRGARLHEEPLEEAGRVREPVADLVRRRPAGARRRGAVCGGGGEVRDNRLQQVAGYRAVPLDLADEEGTGYDAKRYVELLAEACSTVLEPFRKDCSAEGLLRAVEMARNESL